ncbi:unnamed protein product [Mytilus edulis]|uniref:Uncharacterized protein n=1 Tax=Mytilus edulis TaxID=6550 RepID=A0A8S3TQ16_MYTED|nr:unnamed protein product [Mytilus edulis]
MHECFRLLHPKAIAKYPGNVEKVTKVDNSKVISVQRSQPGEPSVFERYTDNLIRGDRNTYRFLYADTTCKLFTRAFHEHLEQSPGCYGNFQFDYDAEEQRTMCWREKVVCTLCNYESLMYPLYEEIEEEGKQVLQTEGCKLDLQIQVFQILHGAN